MKTLKVVNRRRFVRSTLLTIVMVILFLTAALSATGNLVSNAMEVKSLSEYNVKSGDTLWKIAKSIQQEGDDIRALIHIIETENNLDSSVIHPGQIILIPSEVNSYVADSSH
ncbi:MULTISPECIES: LysM peptidoglycan-binding domain-containing protein [unclassified Fusibacter]|uniref:cell division suppressor protein YneA n=1 Tax=unclassified Fusibacter TaxID=2624464 RepID=UPI001011C399|nr:MULTISPECIES: LysM peptidoglycan-binding domain-containing protein [unclassified Fusibacter]MCK8058838.1 LysM peptidoglycan-binding domain-containing protein [Fusibacter sp. A2]NPE21912.1 LysM peptidoglycan-binding domain-containing protein [Fusibacter sp. A1]RXV61482.1 LysM peptidoglycan-binding domain-containing protein [Fusibacter sp. A1]